MPGTVTETQVLSEEIFQSRRYASLWVGSSFFTALLQPIIRYLRLRHILGLPSLLGEDSIGKCRFGFSFC